MNLASSIVQASLTKAQILSQYGKLPKKHGIRISVWMLEEYFSAASMHRPR